MKQRFTALSLFAALLVVASLAGAAFAQDATDTFPAHALFMSGERRTLPMTRDTGHTADHVEWIVRIPEPHLQVQHGGHGTLDGNFDHGSRVHYSYRAGLQEGSTTTIFTPTTKLKRAERDLEHAESPIFQVMDWTTPEGTDLGTTQYEDAFQRGNFWSQVSAAPGYHVLFGKPKMAPTVTILVPPADGNMANEFGVKVGLADIDWFDAKLEAHHEVQAIQPNTLPIFLTYDVVPDGKRRVLHWRLPQFDGQLGGTAGVCAFRLHRNGRGFRPGRFGPVA